MDNTGNIREMKSEEFSQLVDNALKNTDNVVGVKGFWRWKKVQVFKSENEMNQKGFRVASSSELLDMGKFFVERAKTAEATKKIREGVSDLTMRAEVPAIEQYEDLDDAPEGLLERVSHVWQRLWGFFKKISAERTIEKAGQFSMTNEELLRSAVRNGDLQGVKDLIAEGVNPKVTYEDGNTLLHQAAAKKDLTMMQYLIKKGLDVNAQNKDGMTPLHIAAGNRNSKAVKFLIGQKADLYKADKDGKTPIEYIFEDQTSKASVLPVVQAFIQGGVDLERTYGEHENTLVHLAAAHDEPEALKEVLKELIKIGFNDIDRPNKNGNTALHLACRNGAFVKNTALTLIEQLGANVHAVNQDGNTPLHLAALQKKEIPRALVKKCRDNISQQNNAGETPLHIAAKSSDSINNFKEMVVQEPNINPAPIDTKNREGETALHIAAKNKNYEAIALILQTPVQTKAVDNNGNTPLHVMLEGGDPHLLQMISNSPEKLLNDIPNRKGYTPLWVAIRDGHLEIAKLLLEKGKADCNKKGPNNETPLQLAKNLHALFKGLQNYKGKKNELEALIKQMESMSKKKR